MTRRDICSLITVDVGLLVDVVPKTYVCYILSRTTSWKKCGEMNPGLNFDTVLLPNKKKCGIRSSILWSLFTVKNVVMKLF